MKYSVIITTFNEADNIEALLDSLARQTLLPAEVVIVDALSTDGTGKIIEIWMKTHKDMPVRLVIVPGCNRSRGRNEAIRLAREKWIAVIDAGCVAHENWLNELERGRIGGGINRKSSQKVQAVAGYYHARFESIRERIFGWFLAVQPENLNEDEFLPSSRSLAFSKEIWEKVGGYPENLDTCEDLIFAKKLKEDGSMVVAKKALVYWDMPKSYSQYFFQVSGYAKGDTQAQYTPHVAKIKLVWIRYLIFSVVSGLFWVYFFTWPMWKFRQQFSRSKYNGEEMIQLWMNILIIQVVTDVAVIWGSFLGFSGLGGVKKIKEQT